MIAFWIGLLIMIIGLGAVAYLMLTEKKQEQAGTPPQAPIPAKPEISIQSFLQRVGLGAEKNKGPLPETQIKATSFDFLKSLNFLNKKDPAVVEKISLPLSQFDMGNSDGGGTAKLRLDQQEEPTSQPTPAAKISASAQSSAEIDLTIRVEELEKEIKESQERYERLDKMFQEKSVELEKSEKNLMVELKSHKEFNKIKDVLEKEIKDSKDKTRELEIAVAATQTEGQSSLKRVNQLEEKIKQLEKEIREKEEEIRQAQQATELQKAKNEELAEKLKKSEETVEEKNKKINEIVGHLQDHKAQPESPSPTAAAQPGPEATVPGPIVAAEEPAPATPIEIPVEIKEEASHQPSPPQEIKKNEDKREEAPAPMPPVLEPDAALPPVPPPSTAAEPTQPEPTTSPEPIPPELPNRPKAADIDQKQKAIDALKDTFKEAFAEAEGQVEEEAVPEDENVYAPSFNEEKKSTPENSAPPQETAEKTPPEPPLKNEKTPLSPSQKDEKNTLHLMPDILTDQPTEAAEEPQPPESKDKDDSVSK